MDLEHDIKSLQTQISTLQERFDKFYRLANFDEILEEKFQKQLMHIRFFGWARYIEECNEASRNLKKLRGIKKVYRVMTFKFLKFIDIKSYLRRIAESLERMERRY